MKTCNGCGIAKPESEYYVDRQKASGIGSRCKTCIKAQVIARNHSPEGRAWQEQYRKTETYKAKKKRYYQRPNGKETSSRGSKRYIAKYPDRYQAHLAITKAVLSRKLAPAKEHACQQASPDCKGIMQYHHYLGYAPEHWLDLMHLCDYHHKLADRNANSVNQVLHKPLVDKVG